MLEIVRLSLGERNLSERFIYRQKEKVSAVNIGKEKCLKGKL